MKALATRVFVGAALLAAQLVSAEALAGSGGIRIDARVADTAITALEWTCDPSTGLPNPGDGACAGIETLEGGISGDLVATYVAEANFAVLPSGDAPFTGFLIVTGTIPGYGSGSFTILEIGRIASNGGLASRWRVVAGSGSGDFVGITGRGRIEATYDPTTGLASGRFVGILHVEN